MVNTADLDRQCARLSVEFTVNMKFKSEEGRKPKTPC